MNLNYDDLKSIDDCISYAIESELEKFDRQIDNFYIRMYKMDVIQKTITLIVREDIERTISIPKHIFLKEKKNFFYSNETTLVFDIKSDPKIVSSSYRIHRIGVENTLDGISVEESKNEADINVAKSHMTSMFSRM